MQIIADELSKGERTRQEILQAAYRLFLKQGFHGTSMRQIADAAGIALGGTYNHFATKEQIFEEVVFENHPLNLILPVVEKIEEDSVEGFVRQAGHMIQKELAARGSFLNLVFIELVEFKAKHMFGFILKILPRGLLFARQIRAKEGNLRKYPVPVILLGFVGMMFAYFVMEEMVGRLRPPGLPKLKLDDFLNIYLYGILESET